MPIPPDKWERVGELFRLAAECPTAERPAFLASACAGDELLRREVESLLEFDGETGDFIEAPAFSFAADALADGQAEAVEGRRFGPYGLVRALGEGGMGAVYLAVRADDQYRKQVAVKLVKRGLDTDEMRRRFRHERQILATLDHPYIARLIDGGTTEDGQPYLVMEYIEGVPLARYCDERRLPTEGRLRLFLAVCSAVAYAHRNLVVHRDLKPSNVLVTPEGEPKLLDFGIAKLLDTESEAAAGHTVTQLGVMTPEYASPEQVRGEQVTTGSDVYSLGVLLYELLTGHRPHRLAGRRPDELARAVCEQEPTRPSTAVMQVEHTSRSGGDGRGVTPEEVARARGQSPERLRRRLSGDLDNIVLLALRKEPERRYRSVEQFAEDVRRHLEGLPVRARKDTFSYRAGKFVRRHRYGVVAAALIFLALAGGVVATAWQARATRRALETATRERAKAERITRFLQETLGAPSPTEQGRDVKVIDVLDRAARRAEAELADQPEVLAEVRRTIGYTFYNLEQYERSEPLLRAALRTFRETYGPGHATTATCMKQLGELLAYEEKYDEAIPLLREAVEVFGRLPAQGGGYASAKYALAQAFYFKGDARTAETLYREVLEHALKTPGGDRALVADASHELANLVRDREYEEAVALYRRSIEIVRPLPEKRMNLATGLSNLGLALINAGRFEEAEPVLRESLALRRELFGEGNPSLAIVLGHLSRVSYARGDYARAEDEARRAVSVMEKTLPEGHRNLAPAYVALGRALVKNGKLAEAEKYLRAGLDIHTKRSGAGDRSSAVAESSLGECLAVQGRHAEAEPLLRHSHEVLLAQLGERDWATAEARARLAALYEKWGKPEPAK